jgi:branched-subunit amino acid transport protein
MLPDMALDALLAIFGMALVTYAIRAGGLAVANRLPREGFVAAWMKHLPSAVLAALVAPALVNGGPDEWGAALVVVGLYVVSRNLLLAMVGGIVGIVLLRMLGLT